MKEVNTEELEAAIRESKYLFVAIGNKKYGPGWAYLKSLVGSLEENMDSRITFILVDMSVVADLDDYSKRRASKSGVIRFYIDSKCVFEQIGLFGLLETDKTVIRRGLRETLKKMAVNLKV